MYLVGDFRRFRKISESFRKFSEGEERRGVGVGVGEGVGEERRGVGKARHGKDFAPSKR